MIRKFLKARLYWAKANAKGKIFLDLPLFCMNSILSFLRAYLEAMSLFLGVSDPLEWEVARIIKSMRPPVFRSRRWSPNPLAFLPSRSSRFSSCPNQKYHFQVKKRFNQHLLSFYGVTNFTYNIQCLWYILGVDGNVRKDTGWNSRRIQRREWKGQRGMSHNSFVHA